MTVVLDTNALLQVFGVASPFAAIREALRQGRLPPGAILANVATSVEYLTGHHNMNLHGVTSPADRKSVV